MRKAVLTFALLVLGVGLFGLWLDAHPVAVSQFSTAHLGFFISGLACALFAIALQLYRTARVLKFKDPTSLLSPVLIAHGANVLLPSLVGDLYEIGALSKVSGLPVRVVLGRLIHRLATTLSALGTLLGAALCSVTPSLGVALISIAVCFPFAIDALGPQISQLAAGRNTQVAPMAPLGWRETGIHIDLAILQHGVSAAGIFFLGAAIGDPVSPLLAGAMLAVADAVTYLPIPLGGVGVHHWGVGSIAAILGEIPAVLVTFNHAIILAVAGVVGIIGLRLRPASGQNG